MRSFRKFVDEDKKESNKETSSENKPKEEPKDSKKETEVDSEIGDWSRSDNGWVVRFIVNGVKYAVSFSPLDENEKHWKYTYYKHGNRDSSDIKKFGNESEWLLIWTTIVKVLKDFIRIFSPLTMKFIGMSSSKRSDSYKELFKLYTKNLKNSFNKLGYHSTFDFGNIHSAPSFVIKKGDAEEKKESSKEK